MRVALVINKITECVEKNIENLVNYINKAGNENADIVVFSETAITGLINNDNPEHDIKLGINIPGDEINRVCKIAKKRNINVALGVFERENNYLFDSAIFINRQGNISLKYRRISKGWRNPKMIDNIYKEGDEIGYYESDIGKIGFLICGDLFDDDLIVKVKELNLDYLIYPYARSFSNETYDQKKWDMDKEEFKDYINRIKLSNTTTFGANYLDNKYFGGAFAVNGQGKVLGSFDLGKEGILVLDL